MHYDLRDHLNPRRLTIAMWDYSWINCHHPGGSFEDYDKVIAELLDRGFNTVRIDCLPHLIGALRHPDDPITIPGTPLYNWGMTDRDRMHKPAVELVEFMAAARRAGLYVILSAWNGNFPEVPDVKGMLADDRDRFRRGWQCTLDLLGEQGLLDRVLYVDLDQEFPYFSPYDAALKALAEGGKQGSAGLESAMEAAGQAAQSLTRMAWNEAQRDYVYGLFGETLPFFQANYPGLRFTYSLTGFFKEVRSMGLQFFDVLEAHCWIHGQRFDNRTDFNNLQKDRGEHDYRDYQRRIDAALHAVRPMLMQEMYNRLDFLRDWGRELAAPVVTTEAWGPWWHMDHPDLRWDWLRDWCAECMQAAGRAGFWGVTPWNYAHPYWKNWSDVAWYREVNYAFLRS